MRRFLVLFAAGVFLCSISYAQDQQPSDQDQRPAPAPSLGEMARQLKLKKQQKEAQQKAKEAANQGAEVSEATLVPPVAKKAHLVTNDDAPERASVTPVSTQTASPIPADSQADTGDHQPTDENWKVQIQNQKNAIAALEQDIKSLADSIHFAGGNCVANCAEWNERQQQKQQEVESMKAQLEEQKKALKEMQEVARKEGIGSSVHNP